MNPHKTYLRGLFLASLAFTTFTNANADTATDVRCTQCINTSDVAANAITTAKIKNGTIKAADIANNAITSEAIRGGAIKTTNIAGSAIISEKIKDGEVKTDDISTDAITSAKIKDGQVKTADISASAITSAKIKNGQVKTADLALNAVTLDNLSVSLRNTINDLVATVEAQGLIIDAQAEILEHFELTNQLDPIDNRIEYPTIEISGANLRIVNGLGSTEDKNGLGNLIIGYNDGLGVFSCSIPSYDNQTDCQDNGGSWHGNFRTGSHNVVFGAANSYTSTASLVAGATNAVHGVSQIAGGDHNIIEGYSGKSVVFGANNRVEGEQSAILGGSDNLMTGNMSTISGGSANTIKGYMSSITAGDNNVIEANSFVSSITGGSSNTIEGLYGNTISGGNLNRIVDDAESNTISGGDRITLDGIERWAAGSLRE